MIQVSFSIIIEVTEYLSFKFHTNLISSAVNKQLLLHGKYAIWEIFSEFLIFCNLFHEPFGEPNNSKIQEPREIFANIARGNVR